MKKPVIAISIIIPFISLIACNKADITLGEKHSFEIQASLNDGSPSKVSIEEKDTAPDGVSQKKLVWEAGDKITIFAPESSKIRGLHTFNIDNTSISEDGKTASFFPVKTNTDWSDAGGLVAFYGQHLITDYGGNAPNQTYLIQFTYPNTQDYNAGNPDPGCMIMASNIVTIKGTDYSALKNLSFSPRYSIVKIGIKDSNSQGITLRSILLFGTGESMAGKWFGYTVPKTTYTGIKSIWDWRGASTGWSKSVLMNNINQVLTPELQYFFIVVPPGEHGALTLTLSGTTPDSKETSRSFALTNTVLTTVAGKIHRLPLINWNSFKVSTTAEGIIEPLTDEIVEEDIW